MPTASPRVLDLRPLPPRERHALIFSTYEGLEGGTSFELVNDHDPRPLYFQLSDRYGNRLTWAYHETGPEVWRIEVGKLAHVQGGETCCGSCG